MKIVRPEEVTTGTLVASNVENESPDWAPGTYAAGSQVVYGEYVYEALTSTSDRPDTGAAATSPTWVRLGVANLWRMFRAGTDSRSAQGGAIDVTVTGATSVTTLAALGLRGASVRVVVEAPEGWGGAGGGGSPGYSDPFSVVSYPQAFSCTELAWSEEAGIMVVSDGSSLYHSTDGINFSLAAADGFGATSVVNWVPELGIFVCVRRYLTSGANASHLVSADGVNWAAYLDTNVLASDVAWSPELGLLVACNTQESPGGITVSTDGINWSRDSVVINGLAGGFIPKYGSSIAWSPALGAFIILGLDGHVLKSTDGYVWDVLLADYPGYSYASGSSAMESLLWAPGDNVFFGPATDSTGAYLSVDGFNWTHHPMNSEDWRFSAYSPERSAFLTIGFDSGYSKSIAYSYDGQSWTYDVAGTENKYWGWWEVIWAESLGKFIASGRGEDVGIVHINVPAEGTA
jgi:hypothetical protein